MDEQAWPFPILKPEAEWSEFDRDYVDLMQTAYAEGFHPRDGQGSSIELGQRLERRSVCLVFRGVHNGWEPFLGDFERSIRLGPSYELPDGEHACVCIRPPFRAAAHLALEWMRGQSLKQLLSDFEFVGGYPVGITLRREVLTRTLTTSD